MSNINGFLEKLIGNIPDQQEKIDTIYELLKVLTAEIETIKLYQFNSDTEKKYATGSMSITATRDPSEQAIALNIKNNKILTDKGIQSTDYEGGLSLSNKGFFLGKKIYADGVKYELEVDRLRVRDSIAANQFLLQQTKAVNGNLFITSTGKIKLTAPKTAAFTSFTLDSFKKVDDNGNYNDTTLNFNNLPLAIKNKDREWTSIAKVSWTTNYLDGYDQAVFTLMSGTKEYITFDNCKIDNKPTTNSVRNEKELHLYVFTPDMEKYLPLTLRISYKTFGSAIFKDIEKFIIKEE